MLGKDEVVARLISGEISISYEFDPTGSPVPRRLAEPVRVDPNEPGSLGYRLFERHFFGDRLGLTLGPVVVSDHFSRLHGRVLFKGRPGHFDLTKTGGEIEIMPGESLTVNTIEYVALGAQTAAYILPRLTLATAGLVVATTYIDPQWEGILQLYLTNLSPHPYGLRFGERVAICRFYTVVGAPTPSSVKSSFAQKSHHFGHNWQRVLDTDAETQPRRKGRVPAAVYAERLKRGLRNLITTWQNITGIALVVALISAIFAYARFEEKAAQIDSLMSEVKSLQAGSVAATNLAESLQRRLPLAGTIEFELPAGQVSWTRDLRLAREPPAMAEVWVQCEPDDPSIVIEGVLRKEPLSQSYVLGVTLRRAARPAPAPSPVRYRVRWLIVAP